MSLWIYRTVFTSAVTRYLISLRLSKKIAIGQSTAVIAIRYKNDHK